MNATHDKPAFREPTVITSGFATVDVLLGTNFEAAPGGTAVNVAASLSSLGWNASVVGTVGDDPAGALLTQVLKRGGVGVSHLRHDSNWTTPVVLQEQRNGDHVWRFSCPMCGAKFAKHRPSPLSYAELLASSLTAPDVFFFDRVSLFTLHLASRWSQAGSLVVFEPAALGRPQLFDRAVEIADLVKFSSERAEAFRERLGDAKSSLIETLGEDGAQFRLRASSAWTRREAHSIASWVDSAGAGDWTTAGIINSLLRTRRRSTSFGEDEVEWSRAVDAGQRLGALACTWRGVRREKPVSMQLDTFESFACPRHLERGMQSFAETRGPIVFA